MQVLKVTSSLLIAATALVVSAASASAFSFSVGGTQVTGEGFKSNVAGNVTVDFNSGTAPSSGFATYSGITNNIVQGSVSGSNATPFGNTSKYLTISPAGSRVVGATGSVEINFAQAIDYFGLYWGSVDTYNYIDFYQGNQLVKTFGGGDISQTARGSWTASSDNLYVNFFSDKQNGEVFDKVVLRSNGVAFESDNHAYRLAQPVPEPATMAGLALVGLGLVFVRHRASKVTV